MKENKGVIDVCKWRTIKRTDILDDVSFKCLNIVLDRKEKKNWKKCPHAGNATRKDITIEEKVIYRNSTRKITSLPIEYYA